jgi:hypothetical protein
MTRTTKHTQVKDLEEAAAFARGADFLSEAFVFFVGGAFLGLCACRNVSVCMVERCDHIMGRGGKRVAPSRVLCRAQSRKWTNQSNHESQYEGTHAHDP